MESLNKLIYEVLWQMLPFFWRLLKTVEEEWLLRVIIYVLRMKNGTKHQETDVLFACLLKNLKVCL